MAKFLNNSESGLIKTTQEQALYVNDTAPTESKVSILLVDDRPENLLALSAVLDSLNQNLVQANSGSEALRHLLNHDFAVILLDVQMPGMDGFETASMIRSRERSQHTPLIFITGLNHNEAHVFRGYSLGAVDYILKPFEPEILKLKVAVFISLFQKAAEVKRQATRLEAANKKLEGEITSRHQAEEALRQAEAKYRSIFENAVEGIFQTTPDGQYLSANPALARIYGYESPESLIASYSNIRQQLYVDPNLQAKFVHLIEKHGAVSGFEAQVYRQDGSVIWIAESGHAVRNANGTLLYYEGTVKDVTQCKQSEEAVIRARVAETAKFELEKEITERKQAEENLRKSQEMLQLVMDHIPQSIFWKDRNSVYLGCNHNFARLAGIGNPENIVGKTDYDLPSKKEEADFYIECDRRVMETDTPEYHIIEPLLQADGNHIWLETNKIPLHDLAGNVISILGTFEDITERKQAEEDIRNALEKEKELGEIKSRFVTMASHEFRTPLATILSSTELIEHYSHKWSEEKKLTHLQRIQASVKQMTGLLNDVLLIGKAEAGKLEFKPTPLALAQFCRNLVEEIQLTASNHTIAFCSQGQCTNVCMDEKLLRHILSNLLSNAIKYSPQGGTINFELIYNQETVTFQVRDQGIGIPETDQAQLFNSFHRASNVGTISGTGLGLTIVKKSVDLHGGKIAVKTEVEVGTTFTVTLPLALQL